MIGIVSYLLISFWYTRIQAVKAALLALTMNRMGDWLLSVSFFALIALFGSLDYSIIFNLTPLFNETSITIIALLLFGGACAKSAQIPLHSWLPGSMEGLNNKLFLLFILIIYLFLINHNVEFELVIYCSSIPAIVKNISKNNLSVITGNMLGDGSIQYSKNKLGKYSGEARFSMTMDSYSLNYINHLYETIYKEFSSAGIISYPNIKLPQHIGKTVTQYSFNTKSIPEFTALHNILYKWNNEENRFIKIIPLNIEEMFSPISLAYWIMNDGYFDSHGRTKTILLCTESFSKLEFNLLQSLLSNYNIKTTLKIRNKEKDRYRIRISKTSMSLERELVIPYFHNDFLYKLGY